MNSYSSYKSLPKPDKDIVSPTLKFDVLEKSILSITLTTLKLTLEVLPVPT